MKIPFAKVEIGDKFLFNGELCKKTDQSRFIVLEGVYIGSTWYLCYDEEFPEVEIKEDPVTKYWYKRANQNIPR